MFELQKQTGWTDNYLLWGVSHLNLKIKAADAMRYKTKEVKEVENWDDVTFKCD